MINAGCESGIGHGLNLRTRARGASDMSMGIQRSSFSIHLTKEVTCFFAFIGGSKIEFSCKQGQLTPHQLKSSEKIHQTSSQILLTAIETSQHIRICTVLIPSSIP